MWSTVTEGLRRLKKLFRSPTSMEKYLAGRLYATHTLEDDPRAVARLWDESQTDRIMGGDGCFDRGIRDVLLEQDLPDPEDPMP